MKYITALAAMALACTAQAQLVISEVNGMQVTPTAAKLSLARGSTFSTTGAYSIALTATANTALTFPTTGTLATRAGTEALTGKTVNGLTVTTTTGTLTLANGSTLATSGAHSVTLTLAADANVNVPANGTLATLSDVVPASQSLSALAIDWSTAKVFYKTLGASSTFTFANLVDGKTIKVFLTNTASNYTVTWPAGVKWVGGSAPVQTTGAHTDQYEFTDVNGTVYAIATQNY